MVDNLDIIDGLIVGRVRPHIYAFSTNTVPDYLKVGDTYRAVSRRLREWRKHYPSLEQRFEASASISGDVYFRDHSVHTYLEQDLDRVRLLPDGFPEGEYYSREFFKGALPEDVGSAVEDIRRDHTENLGRYVFFDAAARLPVTYQYVRGPEWQLRPNQEAAVDRFVEAVQAGRSNLLMYAVMRFGKTFTSLMCAKRIQAETVLVVSAKADVKEEWKRTVESAGNFAAYRFLDADLLLANSDAIADARAENARVVVFLTLQDLQGAELKDKHKEVFDNEIDLLIVDETHFGARAEKYGHVLRTANQPADSRRAIDSEDDRVDLEDALLRLKILNAGVQLHLSGSPYRILMGNEFSAADIVTFVQLADVVRDQEAWDFEHPDQNEWDNPYFGFPQMIRFAFNPNQSSRDKLAELKKSGVTYALSALLQPKSMTRDTTTGLHRRFVHEPEILDLLRVIDGSQEDHNLLGFLDFTQIKRGEMCRHLVMVLPYRASCDAMQALVREHADEFKNLRDYEILNISGTDDARRFPTPAHVKASVAKADAEGRKTLTLTVNRMLTGSTVEQWDTMLYLKDTSSPQEYDQATFRLQSQHVRVLSNDAGSEVIKENLKPQTLLVDFDPMRLFQMQELRSLMSNVSSSDSAGNADLASRLLEDLRISPVITMNSNRISEVTATNILEAVSRYNLGRSIGDEARDVPVDMSLLEVDEIRRVIEQQAEIGTRGGLTIRPIEGGGEDDLDIDEVPPSGGPSRPGSAAPAETPAVGADDVIALERKLQTYYQRILFFSMLTPDPVASLQDIIEVIGSDENRRIARNLGLDHRVLQAVFDAYDPYKLNALDYKILNISRLAREESLTPAVRASRALEKFGRISDSEVRTPLWLCREIVGRIPAEQLRALIERGEKVLDIASKTGEFALAFFERLVDELGIDPSLARSAIYSLPTSAMAYEFTRRFYEILGIDVANIADEFNTYDLLADSAGDNAGNVGSMFDTAPGVIKFGIVVGNPPYQQSDGGAQQSARSIYPRFIDAAAALEPEYMSFVIQSRWYAGGRQLDLFRREMLSDPSIRELHDFPNPKTVFPEINNRGGICYFLRDANYDAVAEGGTRVFTRDGQDIKLEVVRPLDTFGLGLFLRDSRGIEIVERVIGTDGFASIQEQVSPRRPFGLGGNIALSSEFRKTARGLADPLRCYTKGQKIGYLPSRAVRAHREWIDQWKVFAPRSNNIGTELIDDNQNAFVAEPGWVCSETYLVVGAGPDLAEETALALVAYLKSRFARFLHSMAKVSQDATRATYRFVPLPDLSPGSRIDWTLSADQVDDQLFEQYGLTNGERDHIRASIKPM